MPSLSQKQLADYRRETFRLDARLRLGSKEEAIEFVNQRGLIFFWPIRDLPMPSLWAAVAGNRPVADEHDDPGHVTWGWKDHLLDKRVWYYARVLRRRNTIISHEMLPYFYALSPNFGDPDEDLMDQYQQGLLTQETRLVYEALRDEGPLDSISLRRAARLSSPESTTRFNRALDNLQVDFRALPVGVAEAGAWRYAFIYDLTHRYYPNLIEQARPISEYDARRELVRRFLTSVGAATERDILKLFSWRPEDLERTLTSLAAAGFLVRGVEIENEKHTAVCLGGLC